MPNVCSVVIFVYLFYILDLFVTCRRNGSCYQHSWVSEVWSNNTLILTTILSMWRLVIVVLCWHCCWGVRKDNQLVRNEYWLCCCYWSDWS